MCCSWLEGVLVFYIPAEEGTIRGAWAWKLSAQGTITPTLARAVSSELQMYPLEL